MASWIVRFPFGHQILEVPISTGSGRFGALPWELSLAATLCPLLAAFVGGLSCVRSGLGPICSLDSSSWFQGNLVTPAVPLLIVLPMVGSWKTLFGPGSDTDIPVRLFFPLMVSGGP